MTSVAAPPPATSRRPARSAELLSPLALVWLGVVVGVSFLATPAKFTADSLTRPVALDVGRATFHALGYVEWGFTAAMAALLWRSAAAGLRPGSRAVAAAAIVTAVVTIQAAWLVPNLDERVATIIAGGDPPDSHLHTVYGLAEVTKAVALAVIGAASRPRPAARLERLAPVEGRR